LRIAGTEPVQIIIQISSSVDRRGSVGILLKVHLTSQSERAAAVIGDEAYSSDHRGGRYLVAGAGWENIGDHRHDSRTHGWAGDWERRNNKGPAFLVRLLLRFLVLNS